MALKNFSGVAMLCLTAAACGRAAPPAPASDDGREALSVTRWTSTTELFAEVSGERATHDLDRVSV